MKKYESLKLQYPAFVSLEQLRIICRMSKRSASTLLTSGIIPSIDTKKKTWRYLISIDDVIPYLRRREQWGRTIPKKSDELCDIKNRRSYSQIISPDDEHFIEQYFIHACKDKPDILSIDDMIEITGLSDKTLYRIAKSGNIQFIETGRKHIYPKIYFLEFVKSPRFINTWSNSDEFIRILEDTNMEAK